MAKKVEAPAEKPMKKADAVRAALTALGNDAPASKVGEFILEKYPGVYTAEYVAGTSWGSTVSGYRKKAGDTSKGKAASATAPAIPDFSKVGEFVEFCKSIGKGGKAGSSVSGVAKEILDKVAEFGDVATLHAQIVKYEDLLKAAGSKETLDAVLEKLKAG